MKIARRAIVGSFLLGAAGLFAGCSKREKSPLTELQAQEQATAAAAAYQKLIEESKARVASSRAASAPEPAVNEPADPYQAERWLSNIGYQRNLAARIRQDINLFALLVPEMSYFAHAGRYDKTYLADGLLNKPIVDVATKTLVVQTTTEQLTRANMAVIAEPFRSFIIVFSSSFYEGPRFLKFLSEPLDISEWRLDAISKFNKLIAFDRTQTALLRAIAPVLLARFPVKGPSTRSGLIDQLAANLALYRAAWGMREMNDQTVYQLLVSASQPDVVASFSATADSISAAAMSLAAGMNSALPPTLSPKAPSPLAGLEALQPAQN